MSQGKSVLTTGETREIFAAILWLTSDASSITKGVDLGITVGQ